MVPKEQAMPISPYGPMDLANRETPMPANELVLPASLAKASPRYGKAELKFASDLDKAAYILSRDATSGASRSAQKFIRALEEAGLNPADVARYGREKVQPAVKAAAGGGAAPQKEGVLLEIPDQQYQGQVRLPASERQAMQAKAAALDEEIAAIDAEIARITKQANDGGCL
jgi:DNA-binding transcriptional MerR regulator